MYIDNINLRNSISSWLFFMFWIISVMIIVGGLTRLTDSGLSITEWELFKGILPPLNQTQWNEYFSYYKQIPQYKIINPGTIATFFGQDATQSNFISLFAMDHWFSNTMFALLIIFFTYFYTALQFDPNQVSSTLKQQGGFIPGVKPGKKTAEFIENILTRVTLPGACFLGFIALMPYFLQQFAGLDYAYASFFGGTSLLIVVGVGLDTLSQIESHLLSRHYDGFLTKGKVRSRRG